jgi:hypothetical protein
LASQSKLGQDKGNELEVKIKTPLNSTQLCEGAKEEALTFPSQFFHFGS